MPSLTSLQGGDEIVTAAESWSYVAVRFTTFTSIVVLVGCIVFAAWILPRLARTVVGGAVHAILLPRLRMLGLGASIALVSLVAARVALQQQALTQELGGGVPIGMGDMMSGAWGLGVWLQLVGGIAGAVAFASGRSARLATVARGLALAVVVSPALSGHAAGEEAALLPIVADTVHVFAAGAWVGMLAALVVVALPALGRRDVGVGRGLVRPMLDAFSPVALASAALLAITGAYAAWIHVGSIEALLTTRYGVMLVWKLVLVGVMLLLGGVNWRRLGPRVDAPDGARRLASSAWLELLVALGVLFVTAVLVARGTPADLLG